jgi:hypothetical protein
VGWNGRPAVQVLGAFPLMLIAAGLLIVCMVLTNCVGHRERDFNLSPHCDFPLKADYGFGWCSHRYLLYCAAHQLNIVNTTGEFILGNQ